MKTVKFGTLFDFIRNGMNVRQDKSGDGLPITRIETISEAVVDGTRVGYAGLDESDCTGWLLQPGDILFSHINSVEHIGKCAVYEGHPEKLVHGMNLLCLRPDREKLTPQFGKYLIRSQEFRTRLSNFINKAVNQASVSIGNLKTIPVPLPSLPEQRRIAGVLDKAEELRAKRRAALAQIDSLSQAIFLETFGDPAVNPKGWPRQLLCELSVKVTDGEHLNPQFSPSGMPIVMAGNVLEDNVDLLNSKKVEISLGEKFRRKCGPEVGDLLIVSRGATIGRLCVVDVDRDFCLMGSVILIKPRKDIADSKYLGTLLKHPCMQIALYKTSGSSAQQAIYLKDLKRLECILPPLPLQHKFARRVAAVEKLKTAHRAALAELDALFSALQHSAFRGEL